jgi:hypothetical protein
MLAPSKIATAIAEGLISSRRALAPIKLAGGMLQLERRRGGFYWIPFDGGEIFSGKTFHDAEPLQQNFRQAMFDAGRAKKTSPLG